MVGQFVTSKAGHDINSVYVIVAEKEDFVMLSDGRLRTLDKPKLKRRKHIQPIKRLVRDELIDALNQGTATNEQIKFAIKQYKMES